MRCLAAALLIALPSVAAAQTATDALAAKWNTICFTAPDHTDLHQRCHETLTSPALDVDRIAARGQRLEELPGQFRGSTRDRGGAQGMSRADLGGASRTWFEQMADGRVALGAEQSLAPDWSWFISLDAGRLERAVSANEAAFDADIWSLTAGADWRLAPGWVLGAALTHSREQLDFRNSAGRADIRYDGLSLFGSRELGDDWLLHGYAGTLRGDQSLYREIDYRFTGAAGAIAVHTAATANPDARRLLGGLALARAWSRGAWSGSVETGYDWTRTHIDAFSESGGSGLALNVPERRASVRFGRIDTIVQRVGSQSWGSWQASLGLGWRRQINPKPRQMAVSLVDDVAGNVIRFDTQNGDPAYGEWALAGSVTLTGGHAAFVEYRQRFAHDFLSERLLAIGWRVELP